MFIDQIARIISNKIKNKYRDQALKYRDFVIESHRTLLQEEDEATRLTLGYFLSIVDRLVAKATGVLSYNAIIIATFALSNLQTDSSNCVEIFAFVFGTFASLSSCCLMFPIIWSRWANLSEVKNFQDGFDGLVIWAKFRAHMLHIGIGTSLFATICLSVDLMSLILLDLFPVLEREACLTVKVADIDPNAYVDE